MYIGKNGDPAPENSPAINGDVVSASLWQLDIDNESAGKNGGMGYVLQLSDGRFIVVDGGYETESDADALYEILSANKPAAHPKPIVAAWFVTHMHVDHYGVIYPFTQRYLNAVTVQGFYYNFPYNNKYDIWAKNCLSLENAMREYAGATLYRKLHSGMSFSITDAEITVLCTFEDVYPFTYTDANDTSLVFSVKLGGQKILFLADAEWGESDRLVKLDGAVLKADILQYAHHGYDKQCKANLYEKIDPSVVLWPMPLVDYESGTRGELFAGRYENNSENEWIRSAESVKKIMLKDEGPEKISLPFFPSGDRITDYHTFYEKMK